MAEPVRLVFCITELDPGGAERSLTQLILHLNRDEWEPHVICLGPKAYFTDILEAAHVPVICLNARGIASFPRVLWRLICELRRLRPRLLQTFLFHANILGRIAAWFAGVPAVVSGLRVAEHRSPWYGRVDRWTNFLVTTNVCVSQGVAVFSQERAGLAPGKLRVINNCVDAERFARAIPADLTQFGIPAASRVLISIGRLERQKGIDVLIAAIALLQPMPDDVHFMIVGDGPDAAALKNQTQKSQRSHRVHFVGRREDVPELLAASSALVLPSRWEGMPNVVLEAMAAGRYVIATRVEGVAELVCGQQTGMIVEPDNPHELMVAIKLFLGHDRFYSDGGPKSQEIVAKQFTPQAIAQKYASLYREILQIH